MYPHILSRDDELKCVQNGYIENALALYDVTIVIINCYKNYYKLIIIGKLTGCS